MITTKTIIIDTSTTINTFRSQKSALTFLHPSLPSSPGESERKVYPTTWNGAQMQGPDQIEVCWIQISVMSWGLRAGASLCSWWQQVWRQRGETRSPGFQANKWCEDGTGPMESEAVERFATYINSTEQKIEMEIWALNECRSHCPQNAIWWCMISFKTAGPARRFILNHNWTGELMWNLAGASEWGSQTEYDDDSVKSE